MSTMARYPSPISAHHADEAMDCAACRVPWPCDPWARARAAADYRARRYGESLRGGPVVIYPERSEPV